MLILSEFLKLLSPNHGWFFSLLDQIPSASALLISPGLCPIFNIVFTPPRDVERGPRQASLASSFLGHIVCFFFQMLPHLLLLLTVGVEMSLVIGF
jgi:hypothetical protein